MGWSGGQSTGAEMRKYFTVPRVNIHIREYNCAPVPD